LRLFARVQTGPTPSPPLTSIRPPHRRSPNRPGFNVCIFAYGQTGSGKTHTMSGTDARRPEGRGLNYRALEDLFSIRDARCSEVGTSRRVAARRSNSPHSTRSPPIPPHLTPPHPTPLHPRQMEYRITVQMLEIYNESLRDLLADGCASGTRLEILSTRASGCNVPGAVQVRGSGRAGGFWQPLGSCVSALRGAAWCPAPKARLKLLLLAVMNPGSARLALATCATLTLACHHPYPSPPPQRALDPLAHTLTQVEVDNAHDVARIMACGAANRATSETKMNDRSSRRCAGRRARVDAAQEHR
jgi:hypothetical protein